MFLGTEKNHNVDMKCSEQLHRLPGRGSIFMESLLEAKPTQILGWGWFFSFLNFFIEA